MLSTSTGQVSALLFYSSPSQDDPENISVQLPHDPISPRLASHALFLGPIPGPNKGPSLIPSVNNTCSGNVLALHF